jgi:hypothetical protein
MRVQPDETPASVIAFGPKKAPADVTMAADDAGQHIVALLPCLLGGHGEPAGPFETKAEALAGAMQ